MDQISYAHSAKQSRRIKKFIAEPDSTSGLVSLPKKIAAGQSVTIPNGRVVVHPNLEMDGTLTIENDGELFVPFGGTLASSDLMHPVDTVDDLRNESGKYKYVYVNGYHAKDDGAFGSNMFVWDEDSTETDNGGTIIKCTTVTTGRYKLKYSGAVNVKWFGAIGDFNGTTASDDSVAINAAIDYASTIRYDGAGDINNIYSSVKIPSGLYTVKNKIILKNNVSLIGESSGSTMIRVDYSGSGMGTTDGVDYYANIRVSGITLENISSTANGIEAYKMIRNCTFNDVGARGFNNNWYFQNTWTTKLENCFGYNALTHNIFCDSGCGGIHIYSGRYDVSVSHNIHMNSSDGELIIKDASVQFSSSSAVYVTDSRTVILQDCFFEGNCIGNPSVYYAHILGDSYTLSSVTIDNCVFNNLADSNRNGLGTVKVDGYDTFTFKDRWSRNGIATMPVVTNVNTIKVLHGDAGSRDSILSGLAYNNNKNAEISQIARPKGIFGQDMLSPSFNPVIYAALNVGLNHIGVAIGTYDQTGTIQGYGDGYNIKINPENGDILLGNSGANILKNTNEFVGRIKQASQVTSSNIVPNATTGYVAVNCTAGNRTVTLTNILAGFGREVKIGKTDGTTNTLTIIPASGTINGAATLVLNTTYKHVTLISDNTNWFVL